MAKRGADLSEGLRLCSGYFVLISCSWGRRRGVQVKHFILPVQLFYFLYISFCSCHGNFEWFHTSTLQEYKIIDLKTYHNLRDDNIRRYYPDSSSPNFFLQSSNDSDLVTPRTWNKRRSKTSQPKRNKTSKRLDILFFCPTLLSIKHVIPLFTSTR